jgi:hypothetical protein
LKTIFIASSCVSLSLSLSFSGAAALFAHALFAHAKNLIIDVTRAMSRKRRKIYRKFVSIERFKVEEMESGVKEKVQQTSSSLKGQKKVEFRAKHMYLFPTNSAALRICRPCRHSTQVGNLS